MLSRKPEKMWDELIIAEREKQKKLLEIRK